MTCARGCCPTPADHYRSLRVASADRRTLTKVTDCDGGSEGSGVITEHWHDRQDVLIRPATVHAARTGGRLENVDG
jgi:hypothetical protein